MPKIGATIFREVYYPGGALLETGQTTQYASELDDGHYELGLTKRYQILTTGDYSGACEFDLDGKTEVQSHNCVRDLVTGLMWARYTSAESGSVGAGGDGKMVWTGTAADIFAYCAAANVAELGGYSDWRVPNKTEYSSLLNMEPDFAVPDSAAFPSWPASFFWTSNVRPTNILNRLQIGFSHGYAGDGVVSTAYFVALVRGGV